MIDIDGDLEHARLGSFADDTRLWKSVVDVISQDQLQRDLTRVYGWAEKNNMSFNEEKFELIKYGPAVVESTYQTAKGKEIECKKSIKDLGITFENNLSFQTHINNTISKGNKIAGWCLRTLKNRSIDVMITLLKQLVVPQLEYASIIWSPTDQRSIAKIESVQRLFTSKFACFLTFDEDLQRFICRVEYHKRLQRLKVYSLERRRERYMILYIYKIIIGLIDNPGLEIQYNARTKVNIKPKMSPTTAPTWTKRVRNSSFFVQGPRLYNKLPQHLRELENITTPTKKNVDDFKSKLDKHLQTLPDIPGTSRNSLINL